MTILATVDARPVYHTDRPFLCTVYDVREAARRAGQYATNNRLLIFTSDFWLSLQRPDLRRFCGIHILLGSSRSMEVALTSLATIVILRP